MSRPPREKFRLVYDGIELLPVSPDDARPLQKRKWYLPGGKVATTHDLVELADQRGIQAQLLTINGIARSYENLN